jgi:ParB family chromosome partitioning protein
MEKFKKRIGLGRGLEMLIPTDSEPSETKENLASYEIPISNISLNPFQPRNYFDNAALEELKISIQAQGIIQPITVRKVSEGQYQLISGERRLKASKLAGLTQIPAYIRDATDNQMLEMGIIENIQRENLNAVEIALGYKRLLIECNLTIEELGQKVGKERSTVNNYLRLLNLPDQVIEGLKSKNLSMGHARALVALEDQNQIVKIYNQIISEDLSVRKVEDLVKKLNSSKKESKSLTSEGLFSKKMILEDIQIRLSELFNKKIVVTADKNNKGEIKIPFQSKVELENLLEKFKK